MSTIELWRPNMDARIHFAVKLAQHKTKEKPLQVGEKVGFGAEERNYTIASLQEDRAHLEKLDTDSSELVTAIIGLPEIFRMSEYVCIAFGMAVPQIQRAWRNSRSQGDDSGGVGRS